MGIKFTMNFTKRFRNDTENYVHNSVTISRYFTWVKY